MVDVPRRSLSLDKARGLAIALMVLDHTWLILGGPEFLRLTLTRLAMPLFFVLAGHLAGRLGWRHAGIWWVGLALPSVVPWIDSPNVLVWYVAGAAVLALFRWVNLPLWPLVVIALTYSANGFYDWKIGSGFDGAALVGLMALGAILPRSAWSWAERLPAALARPGRYPLTIYVGHVLVLQGVSLWLLA